MLKYFSMFSGIGGFEKGIEDSGVPAECVGFSEIDKYAEAIYKKHYPNHTNYGNATTIIPERLPDFDLLVGGFPCQAFSISGKRRGFEDTRGTLFFDIARILKVKQPSRILLENVKGLISHDNRRTLRTIIDTLTQLGYSIQWVVLNSKYFGVPQNRERIFIIGHLGGTGEREILFERQARGEDNGIQRQDINTLTSRYEKAEAGGGRTLLRINSFHKITE